MKSGVVAGIAMLVLVHASIAMAEKPPATCAGAGSDGRACNDGRFCTVDDRCAAGVCVGLERPCGGEVGFCRVGRCDEAQDRCVAVSREPACIDRCNTNKLTKFYRKGWDKGFDAVTRAWDRREQRCQRIDDFAERIARQVAGAQRAADPDASQHAHKRCRAAGVVDGAYAALEGVQGLCDQVCFLDGELVGTIAAATYCELALASAEPLAVVDWMRGPVDTCGLGYEIACDGTFIGATIDYVSEAGVCEEYTAGVHETAWDESRDRSCDAP
jgi:hypothetical protein